MGKEPVDPRGMLLGELTAAFTAAGRPAYRAEQVLRWLYQGAPAYAAMTNIPLADRVALARDFPYVPLRLVARAAHADGAEKFLWQLADGARVESVLLPGTRGRGSACLSTQTGCALGCAFCATGQGGAGRDLTAGEIVDQVIAIRARGGVFTNVVMMGMGEPLDNYANVLRACKVLNWDGGINLAKRRITVSTAGVVPGIRALAREPFRVRLAVSLNAADDSTRTRLMPVNRRYPLAELIAACREYSDLTRWWLTFEYVLCAGVNDSEGDADRLVKLIAGIRRKVNLIACNPVAESGLLAPDPAVVQRFADRLRGQGISTTVRRSVGGEIGAACGQLRAQLADAC